jgi:hypothetical protein
LVVLGWLGCMALRKELVGQRHCIVISISALCV